MKHIKTKIKNTVKNFLFRAPIHLSKNFKIIDQNGLLEIEKSIKNNYHVGWRSKENYISEEYRNDLDAHLLKRLDIDRRIIIPWLNSINNLLKLDARCSHQMDF